MVKLNIQGNTVVSFDYVLRQIDNAITAADPDDLFEDQADKLEHLASVIRQKLKATNVDN